MKLALLNPHGWEVLEGDGAGLTVPLGRESLTLHQGESVSTEPKPSAVSSASYPNTINDVAPFTTTGQQEIGTILTSGDILHIQIRSRKLGQIVRTTPIVAGAMKRIKAHGSSDMPVRLTEVKTPGVDFQAFGTVGVSSVVSVSVYGGVIGDECVFSIHSSNVQA